jgi:hypothetical protein
MMPPDWQDDLNRLLWRFSGLGIGVDIASMSLTELWDVYCLLKRLTGS